MSQLHERVIECPKCHDQLIDLTWASTNTFGARYYTDTYVDGPMEPDQVFRCPSCKAVFWEDEIDDKKSRAAKIKPYISYKSRWIDNGSLLATILLDLSKLISAPIKLLLPQKPPEQPDNWDHGPGVDRVSFQELLDQQLWRNKKDERFIRVKYYIRGNHKFRESTKDGDYTIEEIANMTALMGLLGNLPNDQVLRAEILRNLGRFRESIQQIEGKSFSGKLEPYAAMILNLAIKEIRAPQIAQQVH